MIGHMEECTPIINEFFKMLTHNSTFSKKNIEFCMFCKIEPK